MPYHVRHGERSSSRGRARAAVLAFTLGAGTIVAPVLAPVSLAHADSGTPLHGTLHLPDGSAARNADVYVSLLKADPGDQPDKAIAQGTTDDQGNFSIPIPITSDITAAAISNGNQVNLEVLGLATSSSLSASTLQGTGGSTVEQLFEGAVALDPTLASSDSATSSALELTNPVELTLSDAENGYVSPPDNTAAVAVANCYFYGWYRYSGPTAGSTVIGELHTYQDMTGSFQYTTSANSDIGVGYSYSAGSNFKVSGHVHIGNSSSVSNSGVKAGAYSGHRINGNFNYVKDEGDYYCDGLGWDHLYRVRATVWNGDEFNGADTSGNDGYYTWKDANDAGGARIAKFTPGQSFGRTTSETADYGGGVSVMGASLDSKSKFNSTHKLSWHFGSGVYWHYLIGNDNPPSNAHIIYAY